MKGSLHNCSVTSTTSSHNRQAKHIVKLYFPVWEISDSSITVKQVCCYKIDIFDFNQVSLAEDLADFTIVCAGGGEVICQMLQ